MNEPTNGMKVFLRAELLQLKLDLLEKLASQDIVKSISDRVTNLEQHGSPALVEKLDQIADNDKRLTVIEARNPDQIIKEFRQIQNDVKALFAWRNRMVGISMVLSSPLIYLVIKAMGL